MADENKTSAAASTAPKKKPAAKKAPAKKAPAKKAPAKKAATPSKAVAAKKPAARKAPPAKKPAATASSKPSPQAEAAQADTKASTAQTDHAPNAAEASASSSDKDYNASKIVEDLKGRDWPKIIQRALLMVFFGFLAWITISVAFFLATAQVIICIFAGEPNKALTQLIKQAANYIHDVLSYLSFDTDECPFPFGKDLPEAD